MSGEYKVVLKGGRNIDWLCATNNEEMEIQLGFTREQAQAVVDSLVGQGIAPDIFGASEEEIYLLPEGRVLRAPTEKKPAPVRCPRCGGLRVELRCPGQRFAGFEVRIVGCSDCREREAREHSPCKTRLSAEEVERRMGVALDVTVDVMHAAGLRAERCDCGSSLCADWRMVSDSIV